MRSRPNPIEALVTLPHVEDTEERRVRWRQAITALGEHVRVDGPPPLDGVEMDGLLAACRIALESGLVDDVDFITPGRAAVALYELTAALPAGPERRDFGRRVFARLYGGNAATFAPVATRMALGSGRALEAATMAARVSLVFSLPSGSSVNADPLALTLIARPELCDLWVNSRATGTLPERKLAATLMERAAREAVTRTQRGDPRPKELLTGKTVRNSYEMLLADREPLVWRHAAIARGLLSAVVPGLREEIDIQLDPSLSPTEWRRAVVSLVSCLCFDYETTIRQCHQLLNSDIAVKHPALASTMIWGLGPVVDAEPGAAEELLDLVSNSKRLDVAEAMSSLLSDVVNHDFGLQAIARIRKSMTEKLDSASSSMTVVIESTLQRLDPRELRNTVLGGVSRALSAFEELGAQEAHAAALDTIEKAHTQVDALEALGRLGHEALADVAPILADLDASALERARLYDLLLLGRRPGDTDATVPMMERLYDRMGAWLVDSERRPPEIFDPETAVLYQRQLLTLLHLVDVQSTSSVGATSKKRIRQAISMLLQQIANSPPPSLHRVLCATLSRSFDAAVREGVADPSELLLLLMMFVNREDSIEATMEASTNEDVRAGLKSLADFVKRTSRGALDSLTDAGIDRTETNAPEEESPLDAAQSLAELSRGIGTNGSYRGEALRQVILRMGRSLEMIANARGLLELVDVAHLDSDPVPEIEQAASDLRRLIGHAQHRILEEEPAALEVVTDVPAVSALVDRATAAGVPPNPAQIAAGTRELTAELPPTIAVAIGAVLGRLGTLPVQAPTDVSVIPLQKRRAVLPDWLLPRRTIGAFYVVRALGGGGASSVFVARRIEERHQDGADTYALKVPQYDPTTARSISEQEFLDMFREEAGALLSLPGHENLARFVNFDIAARPKPILVMEHIRGHSLERLIRNRSLTTVHAFAYLDGILGGLHAMHSVDVAHLDVKPSNIILRDEHSPVLVDFGLSGRKLRPGCGTLEYCAPEILGVLPEGVTEVSPVGADVYAFACTAFEVLTTEMLFDAEEEVQVISQHVSHDGWPPRLAAFGSLPDYANLAALLGACMRRDPRKRPSVADLRKSFRSVGNKLKDTHWPLQAAPTPAAEISA